MTLRLSDADAERLRAQAEHEGTSMQDVAGRAIAQYLDGASRASIIESALADTIERYSETLRRLGE